MPATALLMAAVVALGRKERLNRTKHAWGSLGDLSLYASSHPWRLAARQHRHDPGRPLRVAISRSPVTYALPSAQLGNKKTAERPET